jgi:antitoxin component YwqK of YwqJK toxin-antitoxin module
MDEDFIDIISQTNFINGKKEGLQYYWTPSHVLRKERTFEHDQLNGKSKEWFNDSGYEEIMYLCGKRHGSYIKWYNTINKEFIREYVDDVLISEKKWSKLGKEILSDFHIRSMEKRSFDTKYIETIIEISEEHQIKRQHTDIFI